MTGGNAGLGFETARSLAAHNAAIMITARSHEKGQRAVEELKAATSNDRIDYGVMDLGSLNSIQEFTSAFLGKHDELNVLINNAGIMACPKGQTEDGFELQFGTNHLGHFFLSTLLLNALKKGAPSRVVALSSAAHRVSELNLEDPHFENREYNNFVSYGQSKTANALFALEWNDRFGHEGVEAFSVHPGTIDTDLSRHMTDEDHAFVEAANANRTTPRKVKTVPQGAATSVWAATSDELTGKGGAYLEDCSIASVNADPEKRGGVRPFALDKNVAEKLWVMSEEMTAS